MNQVESVSRSNFSHNTSGYYHICLFSNDKRVDNMNGNLKNAALGAKHLILEEKLLAHFIL